jgi:CelD/BcsL family acetyltransferase involved in cellulose biosynthesis
MIEVHEFNQIEALDGLRSVWGTLLAQTSGASFFHSLEWLECYWKHFATGQHLRILVVTDSQQPVGVIPLVVRSEPTRIGSLRILTYPLHDWATFFGPIGPNPSATLVAGLRHVRQSQRDWDVLDLRWVDVDGSDLGRTERAMAQTGFRPYGQKWNRTSVVEFPEDWRGYWHGREAKFRKNIDCLQRRIADQGKVELVRYRPEAAGSGAVDPRWDLYDSCVSLAERSWQGSRGDRTNLCHAEVSGFFRDAHAVAARLGVVDLNLLCYNDEPIAYTMNYCWQGSVYGLRRGFDPRFKHLRPGLVLQKMMLEDGHRRGDRFYDLGTGSHETKRAWRTKVQTSFRFTYFPAFDVRAQLLRWNRWLRRCLYRNHDVACTS